MTDRSQHPARRPRALALAGLATGLVALAGCTATDDPPAAAPTSPSATATPTSQSASASVPAAEITPTPRPSTFAGAAAITFPDANVFDGAAADSTVLTMNGQSLVGRSLPTPETAYTLTPEGGSYADLWVDEQEETGVLLSTLSADGAGTRAGSDAFGLQEFDVESGEVQRSTTVEVRKDAAGSARAATARIAGVAGNVVVLEARVPDTDTRPAVHAVDLDAGEVAWTERGAGVLAVTDDLVVTTRGDADAAGSIDGLAVRSGQRRWRTLETTGAAALVGVTPTTVAIARDDPFFGGTSTVRIDLRTGRPGQSVGSIPGTTADGYACQQAGARRAVCSRGDGAVLGIALRTLEATWRLPGRTRFAPAVSLVEGGLVYGSLDNGVGVVLDARTGKDLVDLSGATPTAVNDYGALTIFVGSAVFTPVGEPSPPAPPVSPSASPSATPTGQ